MDALKAILIALVPSIGIGWGGTYFLSILWLLFFQEEEKVSFVAWISFSVLFVISCIWFVCAQLM